MGSGLLKSTSGKAEGPYEDLGLITRTGRDPSLFVDSDDSVLWVLGPGLVAKMKDDLTGLAEAPRPDPTDLAQACHGGAFASVGLGQSGKAQMNIIDDTKTA